MVSGVDHVAIAAKDSRALTNWYCEVLGMRVLFDNGAGRRPADEAAVQAFHAGRQAACPQG